MRFYKITPKTEPWRTSPKTHWLSPDAGSITRTGESFYPASCGKSVLGFVSLSTDAADVTCFDCQVNIVAQHLRNEGDGERNFVYRPGAPDHGNSYSSWADLVAAQAAHLGTVGSIIIDGTHAVPVIPRGTWKLRAPISGGTPDASLTVVISAPRSTVNSSPATGLVMPTTTLVMDEGAQLIRVEDE